MSTLTPDPAQIIRRLEERVLRIERRYYKAELIDGSVTDPKLDASAKKLFPLAGEGRDFQLGVTPFTGASTVFNSIVVPHSLGVVPTYLFAHLMSGPHPTLNVTTDAITAEGFTLRGWTIDGVSWSGTVNVAWLAIE